MIQTWAENGTPMVQLGDRLYKFMGIGTIGWNTTGGAQSGTIVDGRFSQYPGCESFVFTIQGGFDLRGGGPTFSISGNTLTWTYPYAEQVSWKRVNATFLYGIY
jgi:hypothetical protein